MESFHLQSSDCIMKLFHPCLEKNLQLEEMKSLPLLPLHGISLQAQEKKTKRNESAGELAVGAPGFSVVQKKLGLVI